MLKICSDSICVALELIFKQAFFTGVFLSLFLIVFFIIWLFFHEHSRFTLLQGKGEGISLTPHYPFHPLHRHLVIILAITAESSPLHNFFKNSFFPSTIIAWNNLDRHLRRSENFSVFKSNNLKFIQLSPNFAYNCHNPGRICLITRLRRKSFNRAQI